MRACELCRPSLPDGEELFRLAGACEGTACWSRATWEQTLQSAVARAPTRAIMVIRAEDKIVGFGVLHVAGDEGEIENVGVLPSCRRRGLGMQLCEALLRWAEANCLRRVYLEVRLRNVAAQALYRKIGFRVTGRRAGYYRDPADDAIVMSLELGDPLKPGDDTASRALYN